MITWFPLRSVNNWVIYQSYKFGFIKIFLNYLKAKLSFDLNKILFLI